jgi:hypothetical protein
VNPKVQEADLEQIITGSVVRDLEESGFLPDMRSGWRDEERIWV